MNTLKKYLGLVWIALGPIVTIALIWQAYLKVSAANALAHQLTNTSEKAAAEAATINTGLQWGIILLVFLPIAAGLVLFGRFAWQGAYRQTQ
jgi:hypothetical protein